MDDRRGGLVGVGVGPGDPELMTLLAARVVARADRVVAPTASADAPGRAEAIVRQAVPGARIDRVVFEMSDGRGADGHAAAYRGAASQMVGWIDAGEEVCFVTLGDPNIYSTFAALADEVSRLRPGLEVSTVPGITAFQDLAAHARKVLCRGTESLSLVTALDGTESLEDALCQPGAVVVYKGGRHLAGVKERVEAAGRLEGALMGELLGLPGERSGPLGDLADGPASYLVTVIVPPAVPPEAPR